jgi:hypothetical protein
MTLLDKYVAKSSAIAERTLGNETIIMSAVDSTLFTLNPTASAIWEAADGKTPLSRIVEVKICAEFDVTPEQASQDAQELVAMLVEKGILKISDTSL